MTEDEKHQHDVMEKVIRMLSEAKISAYIYADLPNPEYPIGIPCLYQFNTLVSLINRDADGNIIEDDKAGLFASALLSIIFEQYTKYSVGAINAGLDKLDPKDPNSFIMRLEYFSHAIYSACRHLQDAVNETLKKDSD